jgi:hypothetical protein
MEKPTFEEQIAILDRAREKILANPESFNMDVWHGKCGTVHCIAGWIQINEDPEGAKKAINSIMSGMTGYSDYSVIELASRLVPSFTDVFYWRNKQSALEWLKNRTYAGRKH